MGQRGLRGEFSRTEECKPAPEESQGAAPAASHRKVRSKRYLVLAQRCQRQGPATGTSLKEEFQG